MANLANVIGLHHHCCLMLPLVLTSASASVYSTLGHMVDAREFICDIIIGLPAPVDKSQVLWACGIHMAFEGHICCLHTFCSCMVNKGCGYLFVMDMCSFVGSI